MEIIIPLAGPDFEFADGSTKAEILVDGQPLLMKALTSRSWWKRGEVSARDMIFVFRDTPRSRKFSSQHLSSWFPGCRTTFLSHYTSGAAFSALAAVALCDPAQTLCIDLADILYEDGFRPEECFAADTKLGGILPIFRSDWPFYSYVTQSTDGRVTQAAEKKVISNNASAGTYFFRNVSLYASALSHNIRFRDEMTHKGLFFICPLFNGVIDSEFDVRAYAVSNVVDIKKEYTPLNVGH